METTSVLVYDQVEQLNCMWIFKKIDVGVLHKKRSRKHEFREQWLCESYVTYKR
jgi:hypothetical protein